MSPSRTTFSAGSWTHPHLPSLKNTPVTTLVFCCRVMHAWLWCPLLGRPSLTNTANSRWACLLASLMSRIDCGWFLASGQAGKEADRRGSGRVGWGRGWWCEGATRGRRGDEFAGETRKFRATFYAEDCCWRLAVIQYSRSLIFCFHKCFVDVVDADYFLGFDCGSGPSRNAEVSLLI